MIWEIVKQFNWVDFAVLFLLCWIIYFAAKNGFIVELFKLLGTVFAIYISFHYYTTLSDLIKNWFPIQVFPTDYLDFLVFFPLLILGYLVFVLIRNIVMNFIKVETVPTLSKWGGFTLGIARGVLTASLVIYLFAMSCIPYLTTSAQRSFLGKKLFNVAVGTYSGIWDGLMSKFITIEKINGTVFEVQKNFFNETN